MTCVSSQWISPWGSARGLSEGRERAARGGRQRRALPARGRPPGRLFRPRPPTVTTRTATHSCPPSPHRGTASSPSTWLRLIPRPPRPTTWPPSPSCTCSSPSSTLPCSGQCSRSRAIWPAKNGSPRPPSSRSTSRASSATPSLAPRTRPPLRRRCGPSCTAWPSSISTASLTPPPPRPSPHRCAPPSTHCSPPLRRCRRRQRRLLQVTVSAHSAGHVRLQRQRYVSRWR